MLSGIMLVACGNDNQSGTASNSPEVQAPQTTNANSSKSAASPFSGAVDFRDCNDVKGWVWNGAQPDANLKTELYVDGKLVDTAQASNPRPDLKFGTGKYGFALKIPASFKDGNQHSVSVRVATTDYVVPIATGVFAAAACK
jgi:hypothetical protein